MANPVNRLQNEEGCVFFLMIVGNSLITSMHTFITEQVSSLILTTLTPQTLNLDCSETSILVF